MLTYANVCCAAASKPGKSSSVHNTAAASGLPQTAHPAALKGVVRQGASGEGRGGARGDRPHAAGGLLQVDAAGGGARGDRPHAAGGFLLVQTYLLASRKVQILAS